MGGFNHSDEIIFSINKLANQIHFLLLRRQSRVNGNSASDCYQFFMTGRRQSEVSNAAFDDLVSRCRKIVALNTESILCHGFRLENQREPVPAHLFISFDLMTLQ